ncbi:MAG: hypothetical protein ISR42_01000 [Acidimicrobiia bacterium]|nr:hypothetical protein [Actinomycetota bacterium]MBL6923955.1 hypothetical protein [Acidimicrobiia bacterium]
MTRLLLVASTLAALSLGVAAASAGAQTDPGAEAEAVAPGLELEAGQYSREYGVTADEALRRFERIAELKTALREIAETEDGRVAGWSIVHEPEFGGWISLVGSEEPSLRSTLLTSENSDIWIDVGATHTLAELVKAMSIKSNFEAIPEVMRARIAYRDISLEQNSIVIALDRDVPPEPASEDDRTSEVLPIQSLKLLQAAEALEEILEADTGLPFIVTTGARSEPDAIYGGEHNDHSGGRCTSAFAVLDGSTRGMLTAGHCADVTTHWRSRTSSHAGGSYTATHRDTVWGDDGDSSWYTTTQWESDNFYVTTTSTRDATGHEVRSNMNGDYVCHFGTSSGYSCGTVVSTNHDPYYSVCGW